MRTKAAYATRELATLLGLAPKNILARAVRELWQSQPRSGRGGGNEWLLESMPPATRLAVAKALLAEQAKEAETEARKQPVNTLQKLPPSCRARAEARALAVQLARRFYASAGLPKTSAFELFAHQYNSGQAVVANWVREALPRLSRASLFNWEKALSVEGLEALSGKKYGKHRRGTGAMDQPYVFGFILAHIYKYPHAGATQIYTSLKDRLFLQQRPERLPSKRRLQDWYKDWRETHEELFTAISNPDAWRSRFRVAFGDAAGLVDRLNQEWEMDSTPSDLILSDGKRHTIVACIDVYSRRVAFHVSRTSSSHAVATCLRKAITLWGVPEIVRTDNGQDYVSRHIERVLLDMNILHDVCNPFSPQEKPFVERVFRTFLHDVFELLTGFVGHNVSERKDLEARKSFAQRMLRKDEKVELNLSPDELQQFCDRWANDVYAHREHGSLGRSPYEQARLYDGSISRVTNEEALRLLFLPCPDKNGVRKVSKDGGIHLFNDAYIAPELGLHQGKSVQVRIDDENHGQIHVYSLNGTEFICVARGLRHDGMNGEEVKAVSRAAKKLQNDQIAHGRAAMVTASKTAHVDEIAFERLRAAELRARAIEAEQPLRAEMFAVHSTPALEGASRASEKPDYAPAPMTDEQRRMQIAARDAFDKALKDGLSTATAETPEQRFLRAQQFEELERKGGVLPADDRRWLVNYQQTPEYDTQRRILEHFGDVRLRAAAGR